MRRIALAVAISLVFAVPVAAEAASVNQASDSSALKAYATYLKSITSREKLGKAADSKFAAAATAKCKGELANDPASTVQEKTAASAVGAEIFDDTALKFLSEMTPPLATLSKRLSKLHWTGSGTSKTVTSFEAAEKAKLDTKVSHVCGDVLLLATKPATKPTGTKAFIKSYTTASSNLTKHLSAFTKLLERYETSKDAAVVTSINTRVKAFNKALKADATTATEKLDKALE